MIVHNLLVSVIPAFLRKNRTKSSQTQKTRQVKKENQNPYYLLIY